MPKSSKEEKDLMRSYESGEWKRSERFSREAPRYRKYARSTLLKDRRINIRVSSADLEEMRRRAVREGIPYQTLIASILHKYVSGTLRGDAA